MIRFVALAAACVIATPAAAQSADWTGGYAGVHLGYGTGSSDVDNQLGGRWSTESQALRDHVTGFTSPNLDPNGAIYGVQAGYNLQMSGGMVLGLEGDFSLLDIDDDRDVGLTPTPSAPSLSYAAANSVDAKHMFSLRAKAGVALGDTLLYVDGGWAWVKARYSAALSSNGGYAKAGGDSETSDGFIVGAGVEQRLAPNISARLDYSYTDQGSVTFANAYLPGSTFVSPAYTETYKQDLKLHLFRAGINFHF